MGVFGTYRTTIVSVRRRLLALMSFSRRSGLLSGRYAGRLVGVNE